MAKRIFVKTRPDMIVSDDHAPYQHKDRLDFYADVKREFNPRSIYHLGDIFDFHAMSRHQKEVDSPPPAIEYKKALDFSKGLMKIFNKGFMIKGNHDSIPERQLATLNIPPMLLINDNEMFGLRKGWCVSKNDYIVIKDRNILLEHGIGSGGKYGAFNTAMAKRSSYCQGHIHSQAMVKYHVNYSSRIFGMNVGAGCDDKSLAMRYGKHNKNKSVLGCGLVYSESYAQFIPMGI